MPREIPPERGGQGLGQRNARARRLGAAELHSIAQPLLAKERCCRRAGEESQPLANASVSLALPGHFGVGGEEKNIFIPTSGRRRKTWRRRNGNARLSLGPLTFLPRGALPSTSCLV